MKCARCGQKWFQVPVSEAEEFGLDDMSFPPPPPPEPEMTERMPIGKLEPPPRMMGTEAEDLDSMPSSSGMDLDDEAPPLPPKKMAMTPAKPVRRKKGGTLGLWLLLLVLIVGAAGGAGYVYQDLVIKYWPPAETYLIEAGLRHEPPGAGLGLKAVGAPERVVKNDVDVLIVRGVITNLSDRPRPVPPMKLILMDKDNHPVQEKIDPPPAATLNPGETTTFEIQLERPDANAVGLNVVFIEPPPAPKAQ